MRHCRNRSRPTSRHHGRHVPAPPHSLSHHPLLCHCPRLALSLRPTSAGLCRRTVRRRVVRRRVWRLVSVHVQSPRLYVQPSEKGRSRPRPPVVRTAWEGEGGGEWMVVWCGVAGGYRSAYDCCCTRMRRINSRTQQSNLAALHSLTCCPLPLRCCMCAVWWLLAHV